MGGPGARLIDEFTERRFTWITRPLVQTTTEEGELVYYDTNLERPYTDAEGDQVKRELDEAITQRQIRYKARQLLRYYRLNDRHPQKLIMNLAYDEHSVDALLDEARDRWGEIPDAGGSEMEDDEPLDVLEFWYLRGDVPPESPPLSPQATVSDPEPSARGRLALIPSGDVERTDPESDLEPSARGGSLSFPSGECGANRPRHWTSKLR